MEYWPVFLQAVAARGWRFARLYAFLTQHFDKRQAESNPVTLQYVADAMHVDLRTVRAWWAKYADPWGSIAHDSGWSIRAKPAGDGWDRGWHVVRLTCYGRAYRKGTPDDPTHEGNEGQWLRLDPALVDSGMSAPAQHHVAYCKGLTKRTKFNTVARVLGLSRWGEQQARNEAYEAGWLDWTPKSENGRSTGKKPTFTVTRPESEAPPQPSQEGKKTSTTRKKTSIATAENKRPTAENKHRTCQSSMSEQLSEQSIRSSTPAQHLEAAALLQECGWTDRFFLELFREAKKAARQCVWLRSAITQELKAHGRELTERALRTTGEHAASIEKSAAAYFNATLKNLRDEVAARDAMQKRIQREEAQRAAQDAKRQAEQKRQQQEAQERQREHDDKLAELAEVYSETFMQEVVQSEHYRLEIGAGEILGAVQAYAQAESIDLDDAHATSDSTAQARMEAKAEDKRKARAERRCKLDEALDNDSSKQQPDKEPEPEPLAERWYAMGERQRREPSNLRSMLVESRNAGDGEGLRAVVREATEAGHADIAGEAKQAVDLLQEHVPEPAPAQVR